MDSYDIDDPILKLRCIDCSTKFYWSATYGSVGCLTKCPSCGQRDSSNFMILQKIKNGDLVDERV